MQLSKADLIDHLEARVEHETASEAPHDLVPILSANLRRLRAKRGFSLERLATLSGVSRAMLSQIELGHNSPTINVMWRISNAIDVPFSTLIASHDASESHVLRVEQAQLLKSNDGRFISRALFPIDTPHRTEFYELRLKAGGTEHAEPHAPGTTENLVVVQGSVQITVGDDPPTQLDAGDAIHFTADQPHIYANSGPDDALIYLVMSYALVIGTSS